MPRRYKQGADGQPHPAFYGKLPEEFSKADTMRFMVETDLKLSGYVSADTLAALRAEGYDYKDGNLVPAGKEETMQEKVANTTPAAPLKLDVSVRVIEPVKNLMGFASVKFNDCFVVENLKIVQGSKGLFLGMPSQPYITYISYGELYFTGSKDDFVDMFRIVKGGIEELSDDLKNKAAGIRTFPTGFEALMKTEDISGFPNLTVDPATIDEIVVFTSKKGDDYE
ncbi:septation protein SpoVG family protein [Collinsella aerofaciens]|uniref:septation protein SpoVG family protein n=1 Tax=Collinsella aerofaciens TaxID=74426 RepID=UPI001EE0271C|nr:septation protein SpoVG family protein [Collinsella aerofaciens]MCG4808037.1 septation protein SpoVG family protein [Collinsella aerofaciens]MCG4816103.1 septation protein SpoVG family protein [Collinsella aerofaciens]